MTDLDFFKTKFVSVQGIFCHEMADYSNYPDELKLGKVFSQGSILCVKILGFIQQNIVKISHS